MQALSLERWVLNPGPDTGDPSSGGDDSDVVPYAFTWTDTASPAEMEPYAFVWEESPGAAETAGPSAKSVASGAGAGAAVGSAIGTVFPGIGTAVGGAIGGAVGAIGSFFSGLFGGKKRKRKRRARSAPVVQKKPTPQWLVPILEDARRGLLEVPPNAAKALDALFVVSGQMSREEYEKAKRGGQLPSQKFDRNRAAVKKIGVRIHKRFRKTIPAKLGGLEPGERALVSAAMPLGLGSAALDAVQRIRASVQVTRQDPPPEPELLDPDVIEELRRSYVLPDEEEEGTPGEDLSVESALAYGDGDDTSGPAPGSGGDGRGPNAQAPTLDDLPRPAWHVSSKEMPRQVFAALLRERPDLQRLPRNVLRAIAGRGPRAHDTSGVDPVLRQYVMMPGETFAGIARNLTGDPDRAVELYAANPNHHASRMRVEIPPGWLEFMPLVESDTAGPNDPPRPNITQRIIEVLANDWPEKIASRVGAKKVDAQWWRTLKQVNPHKVVGSDGNWKRLFAGEIINYPDGWPAHIEAKPVANLPGTPPPVTPPTPEQPPQGHPQGYPWPYPHQVPKWGGKPPWYPADGPWPPYNADPPPGWIANSPTPPTWWGVPPGGGFPVPLPPGTQPSPQPNPGPSAPGGTAPQPSPSTPSGSTADFLTTARVQGYLATWALRYPDVARPPDFGRNLAVDVNGTMSDRTKLCLSTFQLWWNEKQGSSKLRTDGVLDLATDEALTSYIMTTPPPLPGGSAPIPGGQAPGGGSSPGGSSPQPGSPPAQPGGGLPPGVPQLPGMPQFPAPQPQLPAPTPAPAPSAPQSGPARKDDDAAVLVIGGTMLSLLLR